MAYQLEDDVQPLDESPVEQALTLNSQANQDQGIPDLDVRFKGLSTHIKLARASGLSDQEILTAIGRQSTNLQSMGYDELQIDEMQQGRRPFPVEPTAAISGKISAPKLAQISGEAMKKGAPAEYWTRHEEHPILSAISEFGSGLGRGVTAHMVGSVPEWYDDTPAHKAGEFLGELALWGIVAGVGGATLAPMAMKIPAVARFAATHPVVSNLVGPAIGMASTAVGIKATEQMADKGTVDLGALSDEAKAIGLLTLGGGVAALVGKAALAKYGSKAVARTASPAALGGATATSSPAAAGPSGTALSTELAGAVAGTKVQQTMKKAAVGFGSTDPAALKAAQVASTIDAEKVALSSVLKRQGYPTGTLGNLTTLELKYLANQQFAYEEILGKGNAALGARLKDRGYSITVDSQAGKHYAFPLGGGPKQEFSSADELIQWADKLPTVKQSPAAAVMDDIVSGATSPSTIRKVEEQRLVHTSRANPVLGDEVISHDASGLGVRPVLGSGQLFSTYANIPDHASAVKLATKIEGYGFKTNLAQELIPDPATGKMVGGDWHVIYSQSPEATPHIQNFAKTLTSKPGVSGENFNGIHHTDFEKMLRAMGTNEATIKATMHPATSEMAAKQLAKAGPRDLMTAAEYTEFEKVMNTFKPQTVGMEAIERENMKLSAYTEIISNRKEDVLSLMSGLKKSADGDWRVATVANLLDRLPGYLEARGIEGPAKDRFMKPVINKLTVELSRKDFLRRGVTFDRVIKSIDAERIAAGQKPILQDVMRVADINRKAARGKATVNIAQQKSEREIIAKSSELRALDEAGRNF